MVGRTVVPVADGHTGVTEAPRLGGRAGTALLATVAFGVVDNLLTNLVLPEWAYVPYRVVTVSVVLLLAIRLGGLSWAELGLARQDLRRGLAWGGACMGVIGSVYLVGALLPATQDLFRDERVANLSTAGVFYSALIAVPFGTVLAEELVFRGAVLGLGNRMWRTWIAVAASSLLFGVWHVAPAWNIYEVNPDAAELSASLPNAQAIGVAFAVLGTALAGVVFCWLRLVSRSLLAPMLLHVATNSFGYLAAWLVLQTG